MPSQERRRRMANSGQTVSRQFNELDTLNYTLPRRQHMTFSASSRFALLCSLLVFVSCVCNRSVAQRRETRWNNPPALKATGLEHYSFRCKAMDEEIGYSVYLPPQYASTKFKYPVIYFLHGAGGNENSDAGGFSGLLNKLIGEKKIKPAICIFPNGGMSGFRDRPEEKVMVETMIVKELIPLIDKSYRTVADRKGRVIAGFSMGGGGATRLALKNPELFSASASWAGAIMFRSSG